MDVSVHSNPVEEKINRVAKQMEEFSAPTLLDDLERQDTHANKFQLSKKQKC